MSVIPAVIEQHAEKAAFLWLLRDASVHEPHHSLFDLAHPDNRVRPILTGSESPEMTAMGHFEGNTCVGGNWRGSCRRSIGF